MCVAACPITVLVEVCSAVYVFAVQVNIRKQFVAIDSDYTLDEGEKQRRKQVCVSQSLGIDSLLICVLMHPNPLTLV